MISVHLSQSVFQYYQGKVASGKGFYSTYKYLGLHGIPERKPWCCDCDGTSNSIVRLRQFNWATELYPFQVVCMDLPPMFFWMHRSTEGALIYIPQRMCVAEMHVFYKTKCS